MLADAPTSPTAGIQKWVYVNGAWKLAYTLQKGLSLGTTYHVSGYPTDPATGGVRNITGRVNRDGMATIFGATSTVGTSVEPGADPNQVVAISDRVEATMLPANEAFDVVVPPAFGMVYRGVSFARSTVTAITARERTRDMATMATTTRGGTTPAGRRG